MPQDFISPVIGYCSSECKISTPGTELDRLKTELLCGYDKSVTPNTSESNKTNVEMFLALRRFTLMERDETVDVYYGMSLAWQDDRLIWEPSQFGKIERFNIDYISIWTPKIGWKTKDTGNDQLNMGIIPCLVGSSGWVTCISWWSFYTDCQSDFTLWPYDSHVCEAQLGPRVLHSTEVVLLPMNHDIVYQQFYRTNTEWALLNAAAEIRSEMFESSTFDYSEVTLTLTLQRHSAIYEATVVIPALVLAVLTLAASWIEAGCPTRLSLLCTLAVCHITYIQVISMHFADRGSICPLILVFFRNSMLVCGMSLVVTLLVRWMTWTSAVPPSWMSAIAIKLLGSVVERLLLFWQVADTEGTETSSQMGSNWRPIAVGPAEPACNSQSDSQPKSHVKRLKEDLFRDYDKNARPVRVRSDRTEVAVEMIPMSLNVVEDYDEFTLDASIKFVWRDEFLTWNASDYGGIKYIRLDGNSVWAPEVFHLSSWDITDLRRYSSLCTLYSSGWLHCWDQHSLTALCSLDLTKWPFDSQNCTVKLSTVTQSAEEIDLKVMGEKVSLNEYIPNRTWKLVTVGYNQHIHIFGNRVFPCLEYNFLLRRNDAVTKVKINVPIIVFVVLLLSSFWLNTEQDVRLNLCCTVLLCHLSLMYEITHTTNGDKTPLLGLFFRDSLVLCVFSLEFSIFMQKLNTACRRRVPEFVNNVVDSRPARIMLGLGRRSSPNQGHEILSDEGHETGDKEALPDSVTRWRLLGTLLNNFFFLLFCLIYLVLLLIHYAVVADEGSSYKIKVKPHTIRLKDDLLCAYDKSVRPVMSHDTTTFVFAAMLLRSLTVNEDIGSLNIHCWMIWSWLDEKLRWNKSDYGGVEVLHVDSDEIWVPEISQFGMTATWYARHDIHTGRCAVESEGMVTCVPRSVYSTICTTDFTYWPYDVVKCSVVVGAWMKTGEEITVNNDNSKVNLYHYEPNPNWKLLSATTERHLDKIVDITFPWIEYKFVLQRHAGMYEATVGIPALVIACLVLISFWLPPLEENRINISCVSLICHCLCLLDLWWKLKNSGDKNPLIVQLFRASVLLSGLSLVVAIILRRLASTSTAFPQWIAGVVSWVLSYRPGKLILTKLSPEMAAVAERDETEGAVLIGTSAADGVRGWALLGRLLNWVCFVIAALVYVVMFARCFA